MTPKQVTTIDLTELREVELRCECGTSIRLPIPLKSEKGLPREQLCLSCERPLWVYNSPVREKIARLLSSVKDWNDAGYKDLSLRFVLTEPVEHGS